MLLHDCSQPFVYNLLTGGFDEMLIETLNCPEGELVTEFIRIGV